MRVFQHVSPKREVPALTNHVPSGFFDNASLERWLRRSLERLGMPNDFRAFYRKTRKRLYITACDLDTAERAIFGADENSEVTISQAVQASSALPIFYRPARLNGVDYDKGCFVGQEVVSRMKRRGVIRKRMMIVRTQSETLPASTAIESDGLTIGETCSSAGEIRVGGGRISCSATTSVRTTAGWRCVCTATVRPSTATRSARA